MTFTSRLCVPVLATALSLAASVAAAQGPGGGVERIVLPAVDLAAARLADEERVAYGAAPYFAVPIPLDLDPWQRGTWDTVGSATARWRLRIASHGALSLSLGFSRYRMPAGGRLSVVPAGGRLVAGFTEADNEAHGQLWTPPWPGDELLLDLRVPLEEVGEVELRLAVVNHGYAGIGEPGAKSGACNVDVACEAAEGWQDAARSVGLVTVEGLRFCTGFLLNDTEQDGRPFFLTAGHCGITPRNAPSVVVFWGYEAPVCRHRGDGTEPQGTLEHFQTGAVFRALARRTDAVLVELDDPPDPALHLRYAGWDRSGTLPREGVTVHHPNTDAKRISIAYGTVAPSSHLAERGAGDGTHLRVDGWDVGTTEGGSSGAPLFDQSHRVVGHLHGGYASCGKHRPDWFGAFAASWTGDGRLGTRLSDWLDARGIGRLRLDGIDADELPAAERDERSAPERRD